MSSIRTEVARRRTFAIISHPDAGKTTLTEKLLLFGGAIQLAGTVKGRKATRHATWTECERHVKGRSGAKFKKATSAANEKEILRGWGVDPSDL